MRPLGLLLAAGLAGCGATPNEEICTPINDVESVAGLPSKEVMEARNGSLPWQRQRAEACLHMTAYLFAKADADVAAVAEAVVERCQPAVSITKSLAGIEAMRIASLRSEDAWTAKSEGEEAEAMRLRRLASSWVDEGRAGNCRG